MEDYYGFWQVLARGMEPVSKCEINGICEQLPLGSLGTIDVACIVKPVVVYPFLAPSIPFQRLTMTESYLATTTDADFSLKWPPLYKQNLNLCRRTR